jgi:pSer/pThr/pTyr-binding forkhead associated (FHA) protein
LLVGVTSETLAPAPAADGTTERFDPIKCLDQRVRRNGAQREALQPGRYLEVDGPERSLLIPLGERALHIGRGLSADLRLDDISVSRRHAILLVSSEHARLLDDRSSNGSYVNGVPVQQAELEDGDVIALGRFLLRYLEL